MPGTTYKGWVVLHRYDANDHETLHTVHYTFRPGRPAHWGDPPMPEEPPEIAFFAQDLETALTEDEELGLCEAVSTDVERQIALQREARTNEPS